MSQFRGSNTVSMVRRLGLMATASLATMLMASEAQAQCVTSPAQPLNAITADGSIILCSGSVNAPTVTANANGVLVDVNGPSTFVTGATINATGTGNTVAIRNSGTLNGSLVTLNGTGSTVLWGSGGISNGLIVNVSGANSQLIFDNGSQVTQNPGQTTISAAAGEQNNVLINTSGGLFATGSNGQYLLTGGTGNQNVVIQGFLVAPSDGLAIALGDGDDSIAIAGSANISTQSSGAALFNGGSGSDTFSLNFNGAWNHDTVGFETLNVNPNTAIVLGGTNADATQINLQGGNITVASGAPLGVSSSTVDIAQFANLALAYTMSANFNHVLTGSGGLNIDASGNTISFGGNGTAFTGAVTVASGSTAVVGVADALGTGSITNNGTLSFGGFSLNNEISGTGQVIVTGNGNSRLSGANTFSGGLDVRGGVLDVSSVASLGTGTVTSSTAGAVLAIGSMTNETLSNDLTGNLALVMGGNGVLDVTGTNSYSIGTLINGGAIRVDSFARLGTGQVIANAGGSLILNYNGAGQLLQTTPLMTGDGSFIKEGTGDVVMSQTSSYTGGTIIRAGRIGLNNGDALGSGNIQVVAGAELGIGGITLNNGIIGDGLVRKTASNIAEIYGNNSGFTGTIRVEDGTLFATNGNAFGSGTLQIDSGASTELNAAGDSTVAANLAGGGVFEKYGSGLVTLTGDGVAFAGTVSITGGALQIEGSQNIGGATVLIGSAGTLRLNTTGSTVLNNALLGDGNVTKTGTGTVFLTGGNSYSGGTDIQQGAIRVTDTSFLGTGAITVQQGAALDLAIAGQQTLNQSISGAGILRKSDQGDLTLLGNSLTGGVDIVGGRVIVGDAAALGSGPVTTAVDTQLVLNNSATEVFSTPISGGGTLTMNGSGLAVLQNANSYTGGTLINSGRLGLNNGGALGTGVVLVNSGGILGIGNVALSNDVSGTGQIIKAASGTGQLLGNNSGFSGSILVQEGTLSVASPSALGSGAVTMDSGAALLLDHNGSTNVALGNQLSGAGSLISNGSGTVVINTGGNSFTGGTQINAGRIGLNFGDGLGTGAVQIAQGATLGIGNVSVGNAITGAGQVVKTASGIGELTGNNAYSGGTDIQGGTLRVLTPSSLGSGNVSIANGASLEVAYAGSTNAAINNALSGAGSLIKSGGGTLVVNNSNSFTGGTSINGGQVNLNFADALSTGAVAINSGAALGIGSISFGNTVTGAGSIMKLGSGNGVLTGTNSHSGGTQILGGNLTVATTAPLGSGAISVASGSSLTIGNASNIALPNAISGAGSLIKVGSGRLDFANPFTIGSLMVDAGRVRVNGVGTTNVTVAANASLDGTGRIIGNLVNNGLVAPGNSIGTLTVQGNYTQNAGSVLEVEFDAAGSIDLLSVTGSATLNGGTVRFVSLGGTEGNGGTFLTATGGITGTFANVETVGAALPLAVIYQPNSALMAPSVLTARPSTFNAQAHAAADTAFGFISNLPGNSEPPVDGRRIWMSGFGTWDDRSASGTTLGYGHNSHGVSGGVTFPLDTGITLTGAVGWADGSILLSDNGGGGDQSTLLGSLTLRVMDREGYSFAAGLLAGTADQATLRNVSFSGFSASVAGETSSTLYGGYASGYFPFHSRDDFTLSANVRGALIHQSQTAYVESGTSPLRLNVPEINTTTADAEARLSGALQLFDRSRGAEENAEAVVLRFDLGAHYIAALGDRAIPVTFAASNAGITLSGDQRDSLQGLAGVGIGYTTRQGVQFDLGYRTEVGRTDRHSVRAGISFRF